MPRKEDLSLQDSLAVVAKNAEKFGAIDPVVVQIARRYIGEPVAEVLRSTLLGDRGAWGRVSGLREGFPTSVKTLAAVWDNYEKVIAQQEGENILPEVNAISLINLNLQTVWGFSLAGDKLIALLLGGQNLRLAEQYNLALADYLLGKSGPKTEVKASGFSGLMQKMFASGPRPVDVVQNILEGSGISADSNQLFKLVLAKIAVGSCAVIYGRKAIVESEAKLKQVIGKEIDKGNSSVQKVGPTLAAAEEDRNSGVEQRKAAQAKLSGLLGTSGQAQVKMFASTELSISSKEILAQEAKLCALNEKMDSALLAVLGADSRINAAVALLNGMRQNVGELSEGVLFTHFVLERAIADIIACLAYTSRERSRADRNEMMARYGRKIVEIPGQVRAEIRRAYEEVEAPPVSSGQLPSGEAVSSPARKPIIEGSKIN